MGRANELYIRGGYNVYPAEVERVLGSHPDVAQVAVVGAPDPVLGEIGVAFVVPAPDATTSADQLLADLRSAARHSLADYKAPDRVVVVDALPLTSMMKVDKRSLSAERRRSRRWWRAGDGRNDRCSQGPTAQTYERSTSIMTGRSTPASGGVTDDPIRIGTMLYTLVEPHRGHEVAYNRWYERDHFYAGCQIGAFNFAGARFVSTAPLKGLRYPSGPADGAVDRWWPIPRSEPIWACTTCWTATTTSGTVGRWTRSTPSMPPDGCSWNGTTSTPGSTTTNGRSAGRTTGCRPSSPSTTGSRGWSRCSSIRPKASRPSRSRAWYRDEYLPAVLPGSPAATVLAFSPLPLLADAPGDVPRSESPDRRVLLLWFLDESPSGSWDAVFAGQGAGGGRLGSGPGGLGLPFIDRARYGHLHRPAVVGRRRR